MSGFIVLDNVNLEKRNEMPPAYQYQYAGEQAAGSTYQPAGSTYQSAGSTYLNPSPKIIAAYPTQSYVQVPSSYVAAPFSGPVVAHNAYATKVTINCVKTKGSACFRQLLVFKDAYPFQLVGRVSYEIRLINERPIPYFTAFPLYLILQLSPYTWEERLREINNIMQSRKSYNWMLFIPLCILLGVIIVLIVFVTTSLQNVDMVIAILVCAYTFIFSWAIVVPLKNIMAFKQIKKVSFLSI